MISLIYRKFVLLQPQSNILSVFNGLVSSKIILGLKNKIKWELILRQLGRGSQHNYSNRASNYSHACTNLQIVFSQVLVPLAVFVLIEDGWDFRPLGLWIWLVRFQAAIKGARGGGLQRQTFKMTIAWFTDREMQTLLRLCSLFAGLTFFLYTCPVSTDAPLLPSSREAL